jgi:hypothetical protein
LFAQEQATQAAEIKVSYEKINPDSRIYPLKRAWEKLMLSLSFSEGQKKQYMQKLVETRFKELVYVADKKKLHEFEKASSRYNTMIGEYIQKYSDTKKDMGESAKNYQQILGELRKQYESDFAYWSFLKSSQETTQKLETN